MEKWETYGATFASEWRLNCNKTKQSQEMTEIEPPISRPLPSWNIDRLLCEGVKAVLVARADEAGAREGVVALSVADCLRTLLSLFGMKCVF